MPSPPGYTLTSDTVELRGPGLSTAVIHLYGATVTSWTDATGVSRLYLSPTAALDGSAPIRGGVPVCFPQFGPGARWPKQHGFARRLRWNVDETQMQTGVARAVFTLQDSEETREGAVWPHRFLVRIVVEIGAEGELVQDVTVENRNGEGDMDFTMALHSYFVAEDVRKEIVEQEEAITFSGEVDRCYVGAPDRVVVEGTGVVLEKRGFPELVTWNPYKEKAAALPDMPDDDWQTFVCAEPALVYPAKVLKPDESYTAGITLRSARC